MNRKRVAMLVAAWLAAGAAYAAPTVYIPLGSANKVIAVDAATDKITSTYNQVANPHGLVATPDGEYLVAGSLKENALPAGANLSSPNSNLYLVHPEHGHVMYTVPVSGWTHHEAITPDGRYVISTHPTRGGISVLDLRSNKIAHTIQTGPAPNYTAITKNGKTAYVSNSGNGTISKIDLENWKATDTLDGGPSPEHIVLSPGEQTLYVTNPRAGTISAVSASSGKVTKTYQIGDDVHGLDISDDGNTLFISSKKDDKLVALNPKTGEKRSLDLSPAPYHLNTIHGAGKVYVSSRKAPKIWVVDQKTFKLVDTIKLPGGEGHQMAVVQ